MNIRIKRFMDFKGITSSELADSIGVQRSNVTHVLHGRNKPSFQFISKMLEKYPQINAKWLIMGDGDMFEQGTIKSNQQLFPEQDPLPETKAITTPEVPPEAKKSSEPMLPEFELNQPVNNVSTQNKERNIERIVVFYTDQTFKEYGPSK